MVFSSLPFLYWFLPAVVLTYFGLYNLVKLFAGRKAALLTANGVLLLRPVLWPAAIAMLFVIPCEVGQQPFDIDEAETEICEGVLAEYSGRPLAQFKMMHNVKMYVMSGLFCALFLNVQTGFFLADLLIYCVNCTLVTFVSMSLPHAVTARFRVEQVFKFYWTIVTGLAAMSLILVWIGL
jgi:NADH-quinone oxidoreductase subunit H